MTFPDCFSKYRGTNLKIVPNRKMTFREQSKKLSGQVKKRSGTFLKILRSICKKIAEHFSKCSATNSNIFLES